MLFHLLVLIHHHLFFCLYLPSKICCVNIIYKKRIQFFFISIFLFLYLFYLLFLTYLLYFISTLFYFYILFSFYRSFPLLPLFFTQRYLNVLQKLTATPANSKQRKRTSVLWSYEMNDYDLRCIVYPRDSRQDPAMLTTWYWPF